jgi:ABC-2 type transport system ATP-binding protein
MAGLDPLGRRDVRALILRLRDRGCTVFFSSHVLSDAETLCSRVAILARLVTAARLSEMLAFQIQGWELVVSGVDDRQAALLKGSAVRVTRVGEGSYTAELPLEPSPDRLIASGRRSAAGVDQSDSPDARGFLRGAGEQARAGSGRARP